MIPFQKAEAMYLPTELLVLIFGRLHKSDMKNVRLVCQEWCDLATPPLFDRIYFSPFQKDFEVFGQWTRTPRCARAVKELVYDMSIMDSTIKGKRYVARLRAHLVHYVGESKAQALGMASEERSALVSKSKMEGMLRTNEVVKEGFKSYVEQARQHLALRLNGEILYHLTHGMQCLTSLQSVCLDDEDPRLFWSRHWPEESPPTRQSGSPFLRSWHPLYLPPTLFYTSKGVETDGSWVEHPFRLLVKSLSLAHRNIKSLRAHSSEAHEVPLSMFNATTKPPSLFIGAHISYTLSTIESLHLGFGTEARSQHVDECLEGLRGYLCTIPRLRDLHIAFGRLAPKLYEYSFHDIFGAPRCIWPRLTKFTLIGVHATQQELVGFLTEHPVHHLELSHINLTMGSWVTTVDALRQLHPKIESAYLRHAIGPWTSIKVGELMQAAAQYITSGGSNPLQGVEIVDPA